MHPLLKIFVLIALLGAGTFLASLCMIVIAVIQGIDITVFMNTLLSGEGEFPKSVLRGMLWAQAIAGFILPAFLFAWIFYRKQWLKYFELATSPPLLTITFAIIALFAAYPLVQLSYEVNSALPLPQWMTTLENNAVEILQDILAMESVASFLMTLLLVAILPGIGEELVFRGILQRQFQEWTKRPVLSVWIAAIIFSAIHMQFEGFLPRVALGALLGFVYLWSNNLWVPIIVHAVNNGVQVAVLYISGVDLSDVEESSMRLNAWIILISVVVLYLCAKMIMKSKRTYGN
ncbi:MAG TPA: type II CAAX endopeptidase family protein [Saprospiraceae bacterium]|nr:type II CAAX endopeptidase family protein [Saprospiraceae bacterium]